MLTRLAGGDDCIDVELRPPIQGLRAEGAGEGCGFDPRVRMQELERARKGSPALWLLE